MYSQEISINMSREHTTTIKVNHIHEKLSSCYCRFREDGTAKVTVYAISEQNSYMIAEGDSDRTVFVLFRILDKQGDVYTVEYLDRCTNPMDEMYSHPACVEWYEEYGFCKLHFFHLEEIPGQQNCCRRMYFDRDLYERKRKEYNAE